MNYIVASPSIPGVVGGNTASPGQFPYQASIKINNIHICGGSIINENTILTAAHCINGKSPNDMTVVVGTNNLKDEGIPHRVKHLQVHGSYNTFTKLHDIAIVKLLSNIKYNHAIQPIQLAKYDPPNGATLTLSGWGKTSYPGEDAENLQFINLTKLDGNTCSIKLKDWFPISTEQICTTSPVNQGACHGDSGGPLVYDGKQVGVVSWGIPCATGKPDVFTSVASYRNWVTQYL